MQDQLLSYEIDAITGNISIKKRKYAIEKDEFGVEITKPSLWRGVVHCGDEKCLKQHFNKEQISLIKSTWTKEMRAKRKKLEQEADELHNLVNNEARNAR